MLSCAHLLVLAGLRINEVPSNGDHHQRYQQYCEVIPYARDEVRLPPVVVAIAPPRSADLLRLEPYQDCGTRISPVPNLDF